MHMRIHLMLCHVTETGCAFRDEGQWDSSHLLVARSWKKKTAPSLADNDANNNLYSTGSIALELKAHPRACLSLLKPEPESSLAGVCLPSPRPTAKLPALLVHARPCSQIWGGR